MSFDRKEIWERAVEACEKHIKMALVLQNQGAQYLKEAQTSVITDELTKLIQQATKAITDGAKLETESYRELQKLYRQRQR